MEKEMIPNHCEKCIECRERANFKLLRLIYPYCRESKCPYAAKEERKNDKSRLHK